MSASEPMRGQPQGMGRLSVEGPLGAEITISDSGFSHVADGITRLDVELPSGVYTVRWKTGESGRQWIVRLRDDVTVRVPLDVGSGAFEGSPDDPRIQHAGGLLSRTDIQANASLVAIVVLATKPHTHSDLGGEVHLQLPNGVRADRERMRVFGEPETAYSIDRYHVPPGPFTVRYETGERRVVEQTAYAIGGRTTVMLLRNVPTSRASRVKEDFRFRSRRGIDPPRTTVVSIASESDEEFRRGVDTAELLLHKLRTRDTTLHPSVALELQKVDDPYLKLYAAAAAMALPGKVKDRLARVMSPDFPGFGDGFEQAKALSQQLNRYGDWPDVSCLRWRLNAESSRPTVAAGPSETLAAPPMLEIMWRWASAYSVYHPSDANNAVFNAIADRAIPGMEPWLITSTRSSFRDRAPTDFIENMDNLEFQLQDLVEKLSKVQAPSSSKAIRDYSSGLPGIGETTATRVLSNPVIGAIVGSGNPEQWTKPDRRAVAQLAASLAIPLSSLAPAIRSASHDLSEVAETYSSNAANLNNSDPHKGQFGGVPEKDGVSVRLISFEKTGSAEVLALRLVVSAQSGTQPLCGKVRFYLHPTFMPSVEVVEVVDGEASLTCYAWGAFTVGVETASGIRLELDLAQDANLPQWFRSR